MSLLITLRRGNKTKKVRVNPRFKGKTHFDPALKKRVVTGRIRKADRVLSRIIAEVLADERHAAGGLYKKKFRGSNWRWKDSRNRITGKRHFASSRMPRRNPETEQTELKLFIDNDGDLYRQQTAPIQKNLTKKFVKGTYNHKLAVKLWKYLADNGAKKYAKDFSVGSDWNTMFTVADRKAVAQALADDWLAEMKSGNRHNPGCRRNPRVAKTKIEYVIQGHYGRWEDENYEDNRVDARRSLKEYRENMPQYAHRLIKRRVPINTNPRGTKQRITKKQWYALGGLQTVGLFRKANRNGSWRYYKTI